GMPARFHLTPEEFARRFKDTPIRRAKRDGFVRNVVVALGNSRRSEAVPALGRALRDASALVRAHAAWALGQIGTPEALRLIEDSRPSETDPQVREEMQLAPVPKSRLMTSIYLELRSNSLRRPFRAFRNLALEPRACALGCPAGPLRGPWFRARN